MENVGKPPHRLRRRQFHGFSAEILGVVVMAITPEWPRQTLRPDQNSQRSAQYIGHEAAKIAFASTANGQFQAL